MLTSMRQFCIGKNRSTRFFLLASLLLFPFEGNSQEEYPLRDAVECHPRGGLPNVKSKAGKDETLKVAYLGGSITAAPGWRVLSGEWLDALYPETKVEGIHAAIGGTGSDLGVFRLQQDVLQHDPDLLFVEFAVNDGGADPDRIHKAMEGIIRQTWKADPEIDICFVYTLRDTMLPDLQAGKMPRAASAMEELADRYGIPSIHFGVEVARMEKEGELVFKAPKPENVVAAKPIIFSSDGVHPHVETGHQLYLEAIARSWPGIMEASSEAAPHTLPSPLRPDNWEQAKLVPIRPDMLKGEWETLPADHPVAKRFSKHMPQLFRAAAPGAELAFSFKGTTAAIFDIVGPDGGEVRVKLNDEDPVTRHRIDGYCTYHRMSKLNLATEKEPGTHRVSVTLTPTRLDKREILFERNRDKFDQDPDPYADHAWYASSILLIGEIE